MAHASNVRVFFKMAINVFDHYDRRIDHHADAYGEAPREVRLAESPEYHMRMKATSIQKGWLQP